MKWWSNRYAYPLVIFAILASIVLQGAWLNQLFQAQRRQVKQDLEKMTGDGANMSSFLSVVAGHEGNRNFRDFFLSAEWLHFKQAFDNMRYKNMGSRFNADTRGDSTIVDISLRFLNRSTDSTRKRKMIRFDEPLTMAQVIELDKIDAKRMDSIMASILRAAGPSFGYVNNYSDYENRRLLRGASTASVAKADFASQQYSYNLQLLNIYQLVVPSINGIVIYRMRYYLISSCCMILLTGAVFFFILRLMHNQRLYANARLSFTSNMTHELKTPVATVAIALETIAEGQEKFLQPVTKEYLDICRSELRRLNLMIDKVLNLDQLDHGHDRLRTELFDVQQGVTEVIGSMRLQLENAEAIVHWQPLDMPCFISGDPVHLTNIFYNLIENSIKYGGYGVVLNIACFANGKEVKIIFEDNGPGIEAQYQDQVFERFFRVPAPIADIHNVKGTGLGLNYVKQMIEKHGGQIKLDSEPGKGCRFIVILPLVS